jgi:hypothetical protein
MKSVKYVALVATLTLLTSLTALARDKNQHSVDIQDSVQVGTTQLQPGTYKVEWQESGPAVNVKFVQNGKTVATAPATLKTNAQVTADSVVLQNVSAQQKRLEEIDFRKQKQTLVFGQENGM